MKLKGILLFTLLFSSVTSAFELTQLEHALNEVGQLNCRIESKQATDDIWTHVANISDYHSGENNMSFSYRRLLDDGYLSDRVLRLEFDLRSYDYEVEDFDTGEIERQTRQGRTRLLFIIEQDNIGLDERLENSSEHVDSLENIEIEISDQQSETDYRFICDQRW